MMKTTGWQNVSRSQPCAICSKPDWCSFKIDEHGQAVAMCRRLESSHPKKLKDGSVAWIHRIGNDQPRPQFVREQKPTPKIENVWALALAMASHPEADRKRREVAAELGVSLQACEDLFVGVGWDAHDGREYASFPSFGFGKCVGISRRYKGGKKRTLKGTSNSGVFVCREWWLVGGPVFIVEGPSDTLAFRSCNLCVIGRPSNIGGSSVIVDMIRQRKLTNRAVIVVVELDRKEHHELSPQIRDQHDADCGGCRCCWPGCFGAIETCKQLEAIGVTARWAVPVEGCKDGREMMNQGRLEEWLKFERVYDSVFCPALDIGG